MEIKKCFTLIEKTHAVKKIPKIILCPRLKETEKPKMKTNYFVTIFVILCFLFSPLTAEELPIPTYSNSIIISIEHNILDSSEVDYIKNNFNFGMYTWLSFSHTHVDPILAWQSDWSEASNGILSFKNTIDSYITAAKAKNVKLHIVLCSGLARGLSIYKDAKLEDIRNGQWYSDNNLAAVDPTLNLNDFSITVFGTFSRYARKLRDNLEAKAKAALAFLKQRMDENPDTLIALSGWGEAELNPNRTDYNQNLQEFFCDYSPFAVLEFRDWIQHTGMYNDISSLYEGQGYSGGGAKYQGDSGRTQFNIDFLTNFTTWELKYFDWSLDNVYDTDPSDLVNPDPKIIPYTAYSHGNMMSLVGIQAIAGGFDPPREMGYPEDHPNHSDFWDLWNLFRETMVHNYVKDMAKWADEAGIPADKWYSHQIPGDYLFGTKPLDQYKNARYYSSASPLWTANILPYGSMGATIYDIKFFHPTYGDFWVRTSQYCVPDISQMSQNWAAMEFDVEVWPKGLGIVPSSPEFIQEQYLRTYNYYCHLFNFFRWKHDPQHNIKNTNKETALYHFINSVKDKGRKQNLENRLAPPDFAFDPPKVLGISGQSSSQSGSKISSVSGIQISVESKIWSGQNWTWEDWGDFDHFEIHRSTIQNFSPSAETFLASSQGYSYKDSTVTADRAYFYRVRAINSKGAAGPYSDPQMLVASSADKPVLYVDKTTLIFSVNQTSTSASTESVAVSNLRPLSVNINWLAASDKDWILITPPSGIGAGTLQVSVDAAGFSPGSYSGEITVSDSNSLNSPQLIQVTLNFNGPDVFLPSNSYNFGKRKIGGAYDYELVIQNKGNTDLAISSISENSGTSAANGFSIVSFPSSISGGSTDKIVVRFSPTEQKTYSTTYKITSNDPDEGEVTFSVSGEGIIGPIIVLSKTKLSFGVMVGGERAPSESIIISNSGDSPIVWQIQNSSPWIVVLPTSGNDSGQINISINHDDLSEGTYTSDVNITDANANNSPQTIAVTLKIYSLQSDPPPIGAFDTPVEGSTVSASVPVTGWALDNTGVQKVEIKRAPDPDDSLATIGSDGLIYIGDAVFVKGSRPDVEVLYSDYPHNDRSGWGYMMLTYGLPRNGNGTFTLYAFAEDQNGKRTLLGTKIITSDNDNRVRPFGSIDTPGQGAVVSGNYVNFGWVLTPSPKKIPINGSSIWISMDGVYIANANYNHFRQDIYDSFPGYLNRNGAVGYLYIDTTKYSNGTHNIGWYAVDDNGDADGFGSRFFEIDNAGGSAAAAFMQEGMTFREDKSGRLKVSLIGPEKLEVEELARIEIRLKSEGGHQFIGWGADETKSLPVGSTLDKEKGVFYWSIGPGFLKSHTLHFAVTDGVFRSPPLKIQVNVKPKTFNKYNKDRTKFLHEK